MTNRIKNRYMIFLILICHLPTVYSDNLSSPVILFLGDSLTAGYGIEKEQAYPVLVEKKINDAGLQAKVINAGVSGDTSAGGLRRLNWYFRQRIDYLIIALGANDGLRGLDPKECKKNLGDIIDKARSKYPDIKIVLSGMLVPSNMGGDYGQQFQKIFPELAAEKKVALIPFLLEKVGGIKELNLPDGIHPNPEGQKILCENVWRTLEPMLRKHRSVF